MLPLGGTAKIFHMGAQLVSILYPTAIIDDIIINTLWVF
jgi:hypothetical protein